MQFYLKSIEETVEQVNSQTGGLSAAEAEARLAANGKNKLKEAEKDSLFKRFMSQLADPMIIILIVAALISGVTSFYSGEGFTDVIIILAVVIINAVLGVYQESKAEKAIEALQEMAAETSKVLRDGKMISVKSEDLVVGDVVILEAGDAVPADGRIIDCASMKIEEAALTGESVPVDKTADTLALDGAKDVPLGDRKNMVYMGSTVVYGRGAAVITATGMDTEMGKIADALAQAEEGKTPLQIKLAQLSKILTVLVLAICVVIFAVSLFRADSIDGVVLLDTFMVAVSLAVAAIPEGLVAVVTIVLSMGVTNMSRRNAIIRKLTAVETLGCAQIICSDKTGTLTQNKMTVVDHYGEDETLLATAMALCCDAKIEPGDTQATGEPTECALVNYAYKLGHDKNEIEDRLPRIAEVPFDSGRKMMTTVHEDGGNYVQYTKGAPDEVLKKCTHILKGGQKVEITDADRQDILAANKAMADQALRVLMAATADHAEKPQNVSVEGLEHDLCFVGLVGMIDPVRPEVKAAIEECGSAGITPVMITGDHVDTASAIGRELGILDGTKKAITGAMLNEMSDEEFESQIREIGVYARVQPEHKVRIVTTWKKLGYVTAMTGDGVNDAPSIKSADIGVGMGITGTDVTKNVADMVLADDNFATIVGAVSEGRRIYDNIRKAIQFLLASNMSEVISIFVATLMGFTILHPVHLLWINLVTDCFPALALGMEQPESDIMRRKPRKTTDGVFAGGLGVDMAYQGLVVSILVLIAYFVGHYIESGVWEIAESHDGISMAFLTMSMAEIFHSFNMRSQRGSIFSMKNQNKALWLAGVASFLATTLVVEVPFLAAAFEFTPISIKEYAIAIGLAFLVIPIVEIVKFFERKFGKQY
ncbi:MAG: calcium-translocating P-type ATPase, PMCA-type [Firmicutes bacterium]|nr:calcium-translocating P-type ATPase, PMCA-type [Bacillota bacterium]